MCPNYQSEDCSHVCPDVTDLVLLPTVKLVRLVKVLLPLSVFAARSAMTGTSACLGLGTLAFFTKVGKMEGWRLAGPPKL